MRNARRINRRGQMSQNPNPDKAFARQMRVISIVIASTVILWMVAQWIGLRIGVQERYFFLFDLFALAGLLWAMIVTWQIWRKRRSDD